MSYQRLTIVTLLSYILLFIWKTNLQAISHQTFPHHVPVVTAHFLEDDASFYAILAEKENKKISVWTQFNKNKPYERHDIEAKVSWPVQHAAVSYNFDRIAHVFQEENDQTLYVQFLPKYIRITNLDGKIEITLNAQTAPVNSISFSPDASKIACASDDGSIYVWDFNNLACGSNDNNSSKYKPLILKGHVDRVKQVKFSTDSSRMISLGADWCAYIWDLTDIKDLENKEPDVRFKIKVRFQAIALSLDKNTIAIGADNGNIYLFDVPTKQKTKKLVGHFKPVTSLNFSHNQAFLVSTSHDKTIRIWDLQDPNILDTAQKLEGHEDSINYAEFSCDDTRIISASDDGTVRIWTDFYNQVNQDREIAW